MNKIKNINFLIQSAFFILPILNLDILINYNELFKILVFILILLFASILFFNKEKPYLSKGVIIYLVLLFLLNALINANIASTYNSTIISYLLIFTIIGFNFSNFEVKNAIIIISSVSLLISLIGILQMLGVNFPMWHSEKLGSVFGVRNFAAEYLVAVVPFSLYTVFTKEENKWYRIISYVSGFLTLIYLFLLRTRVVYVVIGIYIIIWFIFVLKSKDFSKYKKATYTILASLLIAISLSFLTLPGMDSERADLNEATKKFTDIMYPHNIGRLYFYDACLNMFLDHPITGVGTGNFSKYYPKYHWEQFGDRVVGSGSFINPHNDFLEALAENGLPGFLLFSAIFLIPVYNLLKKIKHDKIYLLFFLSSLSVIITMQFAFPKDNISLMIIFFFSAAISFKDEKTTPLKPLYSKLILILLIVISAGMVYYSFLRVKSEMDYKLAMQLKAEGRYTEMINTLNKIPLNIYSLDPNKTPIKYFLGIGYFEEGQYQLALEAFTKAEEIMPFLPNIISNKATTLYAMNNFTETENVLLKLKKDFPYYYEPQINLLALYMNSNRKSEAEILINEIISDSTSKYAKNYNLFLLMKKNLMNK